ncbi:hypothetical protein [Asticcacaulis sp.]|uniref:hypothetical protein n=1 Tax=Asticcacaulis sp. TaxID=1872648 RepID=UPI003F7B57A7
MDSVISARKPLLPSAPRVNAPQTPAADIATIARQQGFDKSGHSSAHRDAGRVVRNRVPRDAPLTVKITTETARWMRDHASETGLSLPDIIEDAISQYRAAQGVR